jgi:hypothetical protein
LDYGNIIRRSFGIAWRNKSLWLFGLFAGSAGEKFHIDLPLPEAEELIGLSLSEFPLEMFEPLLPLVWPLAMLAFLFMVVHYISVPALVDAVNRLARGGVYSYSSSFSAGLSFFWRYVGIVVLVLVIGAACGIVAVLTATVCFGLNEALGYLFILFMIPVSLVLIFIAVTVIALSVRAVVVRNVSILKGLEEGYLLLKHNLWPTFLFFLIFVGLSIGLGIVSMIAWLVASGPIAVISSLLVEDTVLALVFGLVIGLPVSLVIGGLIGTVLETMYTLFYFELVEPARPAAAAPSGEAPLSGAGRTE